jgi:flagellar FliJ protein
LTAARENRTRVAKRFRFRLDTLLKVRRLREREAKRKVAAKHAEIARLDRLDQQTAREILKSQAALRHSQQPGSLDLETLARGRAWIGYLRKTAVERQALRATLVRELEQLQSQWREARTQTRILEKLRQRRWDEYVRRRQRREQGEADELAQQLQARGRDSDPPNFGKVSAAVGGAVVVGA